MSNNQSGTIWSQFLTLITVFFFWGFVAASNDILIPVFKENLHLSQTQSQMVSFAFYTAYTVGSLIYFFISKMRGGDILNKIGYKNGIAIGLVISALGTLMFIPAANTHSFNLFISGLFIVGLGFSLQQTAANPLAIVMGDPKLGSQRLSMAGGVNNFGTTIGPLLVNFAIFGSIYAATAQADITSIKIPYLILGAAFILVALLIKFSKVPNEIDLDQMAENEAEGDSSKVRHLSGPMKYPQLSLGMLAIFVYVGVEVSTASNLPEFMKQHIAGPDGGVFPTDKIAPYISLYWASLMMGRWTAASEAFDLSMGMKRMLRYFMPYIAFGVFLLVNKIANHDITPFYFYVFIIAAMVAGNIMSKGNPARQLLIYSCLGIIALIAGMLADGWVSTFAFISVGLFCSTLWPCIFTLAIAGLGKHTNEGSSLLIMMIMGGAFVSLFQGYLSDHVTGIQYSYIAGVLCFAYLAFYAIRTKNILKAQGIDYDHGVVSGGH
ncbi:MAG: MFS transporter [Saprospiraceae bacterium]|nr:MFS transporter [Candidatus Parvibacillus calidus]